jgi:putative toxin-antitoxin system antitoxin component (TIGR02293 family)
MEYNISAITKKLDKEFLVLIKSKEFRRHLIDVDTIIPATFGELLTNRLLIFMLIQNGMPYSLFETIQSYAPIQNEDWPQLLDISSKTLQRYKESEKLFKPLQSERIFEMAEVTHAGLEVFGNMEKFRLWLKTPNFALGKLKPLDLLRDSYGKELVLTELNNINHGILA